jgi:hypothetical protein
METRSHREGGHAGWMRRRVGGPGGECGSAERGLLSSPLCPSCTLSPHPSPPSMQPDQQPQPGGGQEGGSGPPPEEPWPAPLQPWPPLGAWGTQQGAPEAVTAPEGTLAAPAPHPPPLVPTLAPTWGAHQLPLLPSPQPLAAPLSRRDPRLVCGMRPPSSGVMSSAMASAWIPLEAAGASGASGMCLLVCPSYLCPAWLQKRARC